MFDFDAAGRACGGLGRDIAALHEAQRRKLAALVAASRTAMAGYQEVYARMLECGTAALADSRDRLEAMQGMRLDAAGAARSLADAGQALGRWAAELGEMGETARSATAGAFAILRLRAEEAVGEMRLAADRRA